jgi:tripartite-type tricarboxylate transporter receptor subunit TctC
MEQSYQILQFTKQVVAQKIALYPVPGTMETNMTHPQHLGTHPTRRTALAGALLAGLTGLTAAQAQTVSAGPGQPFPTKPITIVVPTAAGGANDAMARIIAQGLSAKLGQPVIVDNKAGGNGGIASEFVARAVPDGHTILFGYIATHGINPALQKLRYDPVTDFEPIGMVANSPTLLVATNSLGVNTTKELVSLIKSKPGTMSYASAGKGTAPHFAGELFKLSTGTDLLHVPYKGSAPAILDTVGGVTQVMFPSLFTAYPMVKAGKLKALGIAGDKRSSVMPDVPTLAEQGIANVSMTQWYALFAPAKTPKAVVERLNREVNAVLTDKANAKRIEDQGAEVETSTPEALKALVQKEVVRWKGVVAAAKITPD